MTQFDARLMNRLQALAPAVESFSPDWEDVLARVPSSQRTGFRRRRLVLALALVALLVVLAVPPIGLGSRLIEFFGLAAPADVSDAVERGATPRESVVAWLNDQSAERGLDRDSVHGVIEIPTTRGPLRLWGAKSREGEIRYRFVQMPMGGRPSGIFTGMAATAPSPLDAGVETRYNWPLLDAPLLHGQVRAPVSSVIVRYDDGRTQLVPIVENYLMASLNHNGGGATIEAQNQEGQILANQPVTLDPPEQPIVTETHKLIDLDTTEGPATLWVQPGANPERCYRVVARNGGTGSCGTPTPISWGMQQVGDQPNRVIVLIHGSATRGIVSIRLRVPTGWVPITLKQGFFLHALARAERPTLFELTDNSGRKTLIPVK
jgi:hypothetical protein